MRCFDASCDCECEAPTFVCGFCVFGRHLVYSAAELMTYSSLHTAGCVRYLTPSFCNQCFIDEGLWPVFNPFAWWPCCGPAAPRGHMSICWVNRPSFIYKKHPWNNVAFNYDSVMRLFIDHLHFLALVFKTMGRELELKIKQMWLWIRI